MTGATQRPDNRAATGSGLPDPVGQSLDAEQRLHRDIWRLV